MSELDQEDKGCNDEDTITIPSNFFDPERPSRVLPGSHGHNTMSADRANCLATELQRLVNLKEFVNIKITFTPGAIFITPIAAPIKIVLN